MNKPTIAELEAIMEEKDVKVEILPNGEVYVRSEIDSLRAELELVRRVADAAESVNGQLLGLIRTARAQLNDLLIDENLDDEKLREASEGLLPNMVDGFSKALQAAAEQPDCGHPFRVGDVCPTCVAADADAER